MVKVRVHSLQKVKEEVYLPSYSYKTQFNTRICVHKNRKVMEVSHIKSQRIGRKRLSVDVPLFISEKMEKSAQRRNITITKFIIQAIMEKLNSEKFYEY